MMQGLHIYIIFMQLCNNYINIKIITGQYHSHLYMEFISEMLKRKEGNCGMNMLKAGTDYLD